MYNYRARLHVYIYTHVYPPHHTRASTHVQKEGPSQWITCILYSQKIWRRIKFGGLPSNRQIENFVKISSSPSSHTIESCTEP